MSPFTASSLLEWRHPSNTPLQWVLDSRPRRDTLAFQIELWSEGGELPRDMVGINVREKEIRFSSRTRAATDQYKQAQVTRYGADGGM
jgi:NTE family protein